MKYPCLVLKSVCKTPIKVTIYGEGLTEDGAPVVAYSGEHLCNYQDKGKTVLTDEKKIVEVFGVILIPGDIAPDVPSISDGFVEVFGISRRIETGIKARNPDGTVNYTELDVI